MNVIYYSGLTQRVTKPQAGKGFSLSWLVTCCSLNKHRDIDDEKMGRKAAIQSQHHDQSNRCLFDSTLPLLTDQGIGYNVFSAVETLLPNLHPASWTTGFTVTHS